MPPLGAVAQCRDYAHYYDLVGEWLSTEPEQTVDWFWRAMARGLHDIPPAVFARAAALGTARGLPLVAKMATPRKAA